MSHLLPSPSEELSYRLLSIVPYRDRLAVGRLLPPVGMLRSNVRSLQELLLLLVPDVGSLPGVNFNALGVWIEQVIGDSELADALRKATENAESYVDGCLKVYELVGRRLEQAREVARQGY